MCIRDRYCTGNKTFGSGNKQRDAIIDAVKYMRAHGTQHKLCPKYKGAGAWFEGEIKKRKGDFEKNGLQYDLFGQKNGEWTYKGANLCVGKGTHNKKCDTNKLYCSGNKTFGSGRNQIDSIIKAAKNLNENGRPHPECPISNYGMETIKSDKEILGLGTKNVVNFQFRRCLLYTSPSPRHPTRARKPSSA